MRNSKHFREKVQGEGFCVGSVVTFTDPTVTEVFCQAMDYVWIDMEHNPHSLETVQGHIMATQGYSTTSLVRVPNLDVDLIKRVLDIGADGIVVPNIRSAEEAKTLVAACRYPPQGIRGYGPRRPSRYGRNGGADFCQQANDSIIIIAMIEHVDALPVIDEILAVEGLTGIIFGSFDLAGSMGLPAQPRHPRVVEAVEMVIEKARRRNLAIGIGTGNSAALVREWKAKGVSWFLLPDDFGHILNSMDAILKELNSPS